MATDTQPLTKTEKDILRVATKKGRTSVEIAQRLGYSSPQALNRTIGVMTDRGLLVLTGRKPNTYGRNDS